MAALIARRSRRIITSARRRVARDGGPLPDHSLFTGCMLEALAGGLLPDGTVTGTSTRLLLGYLDVVVGRVVGDVVAVRVCGQNRASVRSSSSTTARSSSTVTPSGTSSLLNASSATSSAIFAAV